MQRHLPLVLIVGLVIAFRIAGEFLPASQPNFQPLPALFFCGALLAPAWRGFAIPLGIWVLTCFTGFGPALDIPTFATTLVAFVAMFFIGKALAHRGIFPLLAGSVAAALAFHLITNFAAWLIYPIYAKNLHGLWESVWAGPPGSPVPSWVFLRNLAAANVLFTGIFAGAQIRLPAKSKPRPAAAPGMIAAK